MFELQNPCLIGDKHLGCYSHAPTLTPSAHRGPSSPEAQRFLSVRVGYLGGATSGAQGRTA
jgi:hypothetical protein